ncbi:MAG: TonB-dependent siderophore receptor [Gammaproteobacteria bacterium]|nr:TonB-dependent siderophore receptor [Gammaproteobacteria bacterium]
MHSQRYQSSKTITGFKFRPLSAGVLALSATASLLFAPGAYSADEDAVILEEVTVEADGQQGGSIIEKTASRKAEGSKIDAPVMETPFSVTVVDQQFMADSGAKNIQDALLYSSGVYAGQYGFDTRGDWTSVRGLDANNYQDGLRSIYGFYNNVRTNIYTLESIEVLKGPTSVLYGQSELGGIVNAVSKVPQAESKGEIWAQLGSYDRRQVAADVTGPIDREGKFLYRLIALTRDSDTQVDHVADDGYVVSPAITWRPNEATSLTVLANLQETEGQVSAQFLPSKGTIDPAPLGQIPTNTFVGEPGWDRYDRERQDLTVMFDHRINEDWKFASILRSTESATETREHWISIPTVPADDGTAQRTIYAVDRDTEVLAFDARVEGGVDVGATTHRLAVGIDYQDAQWNGDNTFSGDGGPINLYNPVYGNLATGFTPADLADSALKQTGFYLIDHVDIGRAIVTAALRHDKTEDTTLSLSGPDETHESDATTGRVGLMYRFDSGASPYVSYSESFVPNGDDGFGNTLEPTTGEQVEAGVKYLSRDQALAVTFAYFDIEQENRVSDGLTPGGVTQTGAVIEGWELEVRKLWEQLELLVNLTDFSAEDGESGERLPFVAERLASSWISYHFPRGIRAGFGVRYTGDNLGFDLGGGPSPKVPSVTLYDAMIGYETGPWDFSLDAKNLADKTYISWCRYEGADCGYGERLQVTANSRYRF